MQLLLNHETPNQIDEAYGPIAIRLQSVCHDTLPWLISGASGLTHFCAKFYCALTSVWRTSSHFPLFFTQTLALLYVPDMSMMPTAFHVHLRTPPAQR